MQSSHRALFFILISIFSTVDSASLPGFVEIKEFAGSSAKRFSLSPNSCNNVGTALGSGKVHEIETNGNCVNLYSEPDCGGQLIRFQPGRLFSYIKNMDAHRWENDTLVDKENIKVKSVGPCYDRCDSRNWVGARDDPVKVTFYDNEDYTGREFSLDVIGDACTVLPFPSRNKESMKISGDLSSSCVELHNEPSCGGEYAQLRPGYPHLHDIWFYGMKKTATDVAIYAKAVTRCGSYCNKTVPEVNPVQVKIPGDNIITVFDYSGYYGNSIDINLSGGGCIALADHTNVTIGSIQTYGQCVILYMSPNCTEKRGVYSMKTKGQGEDYYVNKIMSSTQPLPRVVNSVQLCSSSSGGGGDQPTQASTSMSTSTTTAKGVQVENITPSPITAQGDAKIEGAAQKSENPSSSFSTWTVILLTLGVLLLMSFSALGGAYISRYYDVVNQNANSDRFYVMHACE